MNRDDFPILKSGVIYFDSGATALKPKCIVDATDEYYLKYSANVHRGDYNLSLKVDTMYEGTREKIRKFINAKSRRNIVFTSGTTDSINKAVFGFFKYQLHENDEILITASEHASNVLPWFELADNIKAKVKYITLTPDHKVTLESVKAAITPNTKVISLASITNVIGDVRPINAIIKYAHSLNIMVLVDAAQSISHIKTDVELMDPDFLAFSVHKMGGPTGVGVLYVNDKHLKINYKYLENYMHDKLNFKYIRLFDDLELDDYYKTDSHFMINKIDKVDLRLLSGMNNDFDSNYEVINVGTFDGIYKSRIPISIKSDDLNIIKSISSNVTNETLERIKTLRPGMAMVFGSAFKIPLICKFDLPNPMPQSTSVNIEDKWFLKNN